MTMLDNEVARLRTEQKENLRKKAVANVANKHTKAELVEMLDKAEESYDSLCSSVKIAHDKMPLAARTDLRWLYDGEDLSRRRHIQRIDDYIEATNLNSWDSMEEHNACTLKVIEEASSSSTAEYVLALLALTGWATVIVMLFI